MKSNAGLNKMALDAKKYIEKIVVPDNFKSTGLTKYNYLNVIEKSVAAYSREKIEKQTQRFIDGEMDDIFAYSRLTSSIAALLSNGMKMEYKSLWIKMMDVSCKDISKIESGNHADFSIKELMLSFKAMKNNVSEENKKIWLSNLKKIDPYKNYEHVYTKSKELSNINIYNLAGEYLRETEGLIDTTDYFEKHWPQQFKNFDINSMYIDPNAPMLYDITTRVQIQLILGYGYNGEYAAYLDNHLKNAGYATLLMQSSSYQFPFGGRSNQYQFNEALIAANCEYEASRYKKLGNMKIAGVYKRAARLAIKSIKRWLDEYPPYHIKNFYPIESKIGTESYGYYNKYMVTLGNFIYIAFLFADDTIPELPCPAEIGGYVFQTSDIFHKVFANCNGNSIQIDTNADINYDSTGLGRFHKKGIPTELGLSIPFVSSPNYKLPKGLSKANISISPGWDDADGNKQYLSELSGKLLNVNNIIKEEILQVQFSIIYTGPLFKGCKGIEEIYTINKCGVKIQSKLIKPIINKIYYQIPLLAYNGKNAATITNNGNSIEVKMLNYCYTIQTNGELKIEEKRYGNRNGEYKLAIITKDYSDLTIYLQLKEKMNL